MIKIIIRLWFDQCTRPWYMGRSNNLGTAASRGKITIAVLLRWTDSVMLIRLTAFQTRLFLLLTVCCCLSLLLLPPAGCHCLLLPAAAPCTLPSALHLRLQDHSPPDQHHDEDSEVPAALGRRVYAGLCHEQRVCSLPGGHQRRCLCCLQRTQQAHLYCHLLEERQEVRRQVRPQAP